MQPFVTLTLNVLTSSMVHEFPLTRSDLFSALGFRKCFILEYWAGTEQGVGEQFIILILETHSKHCWQVIQKCA